uniref:SEC63 domain-containing protein n=1 Tax=Steinernema glaseri TaxID=37863 RepID=A0A1I8A7N3_9BILA
MKCRLQFSLEILGPGRGSTDVYSSVFTKEKCANWVAFIADVTTDHVLVMKKLPPVEGTRRAELSFVAPEETGFHSLDLIIMSDSYLNADVQCHLCNLIVVP